VSEKLEAAKVNLDRGEMDAAISNLLEHLNGDPLDEAALMMLGAAFISKGQTGIAIALTRQAIEIRGKRGRTFPEALTNLGTAFKMENRNEAAAEIWSMALECEDVPSERAKILCNLGSCFVHEGKPAQAVKYYDEAMRLSSDMPEAAYNRSLAYLEQGRWREGWQGYHAGFKTQHRPARRYVGVPEWDGTPGQTVIVWGEQGVGDEILFASCLPDMIRTCKRVILDCHPRLEATFKRSFPGVEVHGTRKQLNDLRWMDNCDADASICISSLPMFFRNSDASFPGTAYLNAGTELSPASFNRMPLPGRPIRIGISWAGGTKKTRSDLRSIPLPEFAGLIGSIDADRYSLQYTDTAAREVCELEETTGLHLRHYPGRVQCRDYDKTMSFIASLDLVITVCTTAYHAAGALGVPVWCLVPSKPAWRYADKGQLWYGSARFFRQAPDEEWSAVLARVQDALAEKFARRAA
jgi:hypothetical protein